MNGLFYLMKSKYAKLLQKFTDIDDKLFISMYKCDDIICKLSETRTALLSIGKSTDAVDEKIRAVYNKKIELQSKRA